MPKIGDKEVWVNWIDEATARRKAKERGAGDDDGLWDYIEMSDATIVRRFPTKALAVAWARRNRDKDMYGMPRVEEHTYQRVYDDLGEDCGYADWEETGQWEIDGADVVEIGA